MTFDTKGRPRNQYSWPVGMTPEETQLCRVFGLQHTGMEPCTAETYDAFKALVCGARLRNEISPARTQQLLRNADKRWAREQEGQP